ncbi:MAG: heavy metal-responsive transcriptional regulator [Elusimicrobia bacterium]|nr:heavy metal-responsive transcriptional regulator [Elusimicrobiota bacterium]
MNGELTIGKVAKQAGVNIQTIRYYERTGLLSPSARRESGYRLYAPEAVQKLRFIKNAQALGFTLKEISDLLRLRVSHPVRCGAVKTKAEVKLRDVEAKVQSLQAIKRTLQDLVSTCQRRATTDQCPILNSLEVKQPH